MELSSGVEAWHILPEGKFKLAKWRLLKSVHVCVGPSGIYHQSYLQVLQKKRQGSKKASGSSFPNQSI